MTVWAPRRRFVKNHRSSLLVDAFWRHLEERRPGRSREFIIRIHIRLCGYVLERDGDLGVLEIVETLCGSDVVVVIAAVVYNRNLGVS